uniref:Uncharacterized protein n=1 Tax=Romanomermis culicivorax TaxID=13658 RepID=A0A915JXU7_ROMCU
MWDKSAMSENKSEMPNAFKQGTKSIDQSQTITATSVGHYQRFAKVVFGVTKMCRCCLDRRSLNLKDNMNKQSTLSRFIVQKKMDNADPRSEESDEAVVHMIAVDDKPSRVVENPGFINLIKKRGQRREEHNEMVCFGLKEKEICSGDKKMKEIFFGNRMFVLEDK